jgi:hypothetical protein
MMNNDVEDLLRESMQRFTADLRAPAGLTRRVVRRRRRRRLALRSGTAAAALTAGAVAVAVVVLPAAGHDSADASASMVKRVSGALSAAEPGQIAQMKVTIRTVAMPGGMSVTTTAEEWSYDGRWRLLANSPAGDPVYDEGFSASSVYTVVSYQTRSWAREHESAVPAEPTPPPMVKSPPTPVSGPRGCNRLLVFVPGPRIGLSTGSLRATVASDLRTAISCGMLAVAGRQRVDGIEAIELTSRPDSPISETIWVSPGTYLPVRVVIRSAPGILGLLTADITWLPPTAQNLARLAVPIPAGFRQVSLAEGVGPVLPQPPYGSLPKPRPFCLSPMEITRLRLSCAQSLRPTPAYSQIFDASAPTAPSGRQ